MRPALEQPALSRATLDRAAHRRSEPDLIDTLLRSAEQVAPQTEQVAGQVLVLQLDGDRAPVLTDEDGVRLALRPAATAATGSLLIYLGQDRGREYLLSADPGTPWSGSLGTGEQLATLRDVGALLDDTDAGLLTTAVALVNWHTTHPHCSRCGELTSPSSAGWSRTCPVCGAQHFPRTDPAVIMAVIDADDRIMLGRQTVWPAKRFSTLAGFVEPGESLEDAVRREVLEESGVPVGQVTYQGSQPWPFPSSLMLAFSARAIGTEISVDGDELEEARWWSRDELSLDVASGELLLPPPVSIARRLIEQWYGRPIEDAGGSWR